MKNKWKAVSIICAALLLCAAALGVLRVAGAAGYRYENAAEYDAGDAEITQDVRNLDIDWVCGKVSVAFHPGNTVNIAEEANQSLNGDTRVRWWLDGDTLRVRYEKEGFRLHRNLRKDLTVTLPEGTVLGEAVIHTTTGDLDIPALQAERAELRVTTGDIHACMNARTVRTAVTTGAVDLRLTRPAEDVNIKVTSGSVLLKMQEAERVELSITSGAASVWAEQIGTYAAKATTGSIRTETAEIVRAEIRCTSGDIQLHTERLETLKAHATTGNITLALPEEPGFTARLHAASGKITCQVPASVRDGVYVCGDGSGAVELSTTTGNIDVILPE